MPAKEGKPETVQHFWLTPYIPVQLDDEIPNRLCDTLCSMLSSYKYDEKDGELIIMGEDDLVNQMRFRTVGPEKKVTDCFEGLVLRYGLSGADD